MCGIAGIYHRNGAPADVETLLRMTRTLTHRGPDEEGYFVNRAADASAPAGLPLRTLENPGAGNVGLGHRRLSIIDLATGQQPLTNEDGSVWVSYNGEIYNFQALKKELEDKGHRFRTHCDTETIVHAYEEWGERAAERFRGMFAIAVWDESKQRIWLARDRVGKKPLYYFLDEDRLIFGSEIKAILEAPGVCRDVDLTGLSDYLSLLYVPAPKSIFKSIRKLPAAHYALGNAASFEVKPYWDLSFQPRHDRSEQQTIEELLGILDEATRLRMISDVPLGAFLSGGIDSSAVVALMAQASAEPVITNSISFSAAKYNEAHHALRVAQMYGTDHNEFHVTPEAIPVIEQLAWNYDEPFADSSAVPTYYVSKTAREHVTVSLSGDGGDENFAGYRRHYFDMRENFVRNLVPRPLRNPIFGFLGRLYPKADYLPRVFRGKAFLSNVARDPVEAYFFTMSAFHGDRKQNILRNDVRDGLAGYRTSELFHDTYNRAPANDHLSKLQYLDIKTYLVDDILTKVDRASMAHSLEVRVPILDHHLVEWAASLAPGHKLHRGQGKYLLKRALRPYLPDNILYRRKMGFAVPLDTWFRGPLSERVRDALLGPALMETGIFDRERVATLIDDHQARRWDHSAPLWSLLMFAGFQRRFLETAPEPAA